MPGRIPVLRDPPVVLRGFAVRDVAVIVDAAADPYICAVTTVPAQPDPAAARAFIDRQHRRLVEGEGYSFAIADAGTDEAVGQIGVWLHDLASGRATVGYWVAPANRGRGVARRALAVVSAWGLGLPGVHRLQLYAEPGNVASWRAAEGAGYRREGLLRSWQAIAGARRDLYVYSLLPADLA